ncbi:MAG TPA: preQ(1) synthase [candidate division Zixibacteria bacterium]|nr:preQ(1) synthase [candidate division Zixibacteria bacterium]
MNKKSYQGLQGEIRDWKTPDIETFENIYSDRDFEIVMAYPEFSCICPKTGLPDLATLTLTYVPDKLCLELKSFKEYLLVYRNKGIFHENVVNKVMDDIIKAVKPRRLKLEGKFNSRGGIQTTVVRDYSGRKKN